MPRTITSARRVSSLRMTRRRRQILRFRDRLDRLEHDGRHMQLRDRERDHALQIGRIQPGSLLFVPPPVPAAPVSTLPAVDEDGFMPTPKPGSLI